MKLRCVASIGLLIVVTMAAVSFAGSRAPAEDPVITGHWKPRARSKLAFLGDLCVHQNRLIVAGQLNVPDMSKLGYTTYSAVVWQDSVWSPLDSDLQGQGVAIASDGKRLAIAMREGPYFQQNLHHSIHLGNNDRWKQLGDELEGEIHKLVFWRDELVVGGHFKLKGQQKSVNLVVWRDGQWRALGGGVGGVAVPKVIALVVVHDDLWVAGRFEEAGRQQVTNIGVWDGRVWQTLHGGVDDQVTALTATPDGVVAGGIFTRAGGVTVPGLALYDGQSWQALPAFPKKKKRQAYEGSYCPTTDIEMLAHWRGDLVALGRFSFPTAEGDVVQGAAVLHEGQWTRLPGSLHWRIPKEPFQTSGDPIIRSNLIPPMETPEPYYPAVIQWSAWIPMSACVDDSSLFVGGALNGGFRDGAFVAQAGQENGLLVSPALEASGVHGTSLSNNSSINDLTMLNYGWDMPGDWAGDSGLSGGKVLAACAWQGDLVAAGDLHFVADQVVRHVAIYDGESWQPMSSGIPFPALNDVYLQPRSQDLLLFGGVGLDPHSSFSAICGSLWRWDTEAWTRLPLPKGTWWRRSGWFVAGQGETLWAIGPRLLPEERRPGWHSAEMTLYCFEDTTWTAVAACPKESLRSLSVWRDYPVLLTAHSDFQAATVYRWTGASWDLALDQDLPGGSWTMHATDQALIFTESNRTYAWFDPGWGVGPTRDADLEIDKIWWEGGKAYGLRGAWGPDYILEWEGAPVSQSPGFQPPLPEIEPRRPSKRFLDFDIPFVTASAVDSLGEWWLYDHGSHNPAQVECRGDAGLRVEAGEAGTLECSFRPRASTWYRIHSRVKKAKIPHYLSSSSLGIAVPDTTNEYKSWKRFVKSSSLNESTRHLEVMVPSPTAAKRGFFTLEFSESLIEFDEIQMDESPSLFEHRLVEIWHQVHELWRPQAGRSGRPSSEFPPSARVVAKSIFSVDRADSLLHELLLLFEDTRLDVERIKRPHVSYEDSGRNSESIPKDRYPQPINANSCDERPPYVSVWVEGDLAYSRNYASGHFEWEIELPIIRNLDAEGFVLDLRQAVDRKYRPVHLVTDCLPYLGSGRFKWARERTASGDKGSWQSPDRYRGFSKTPVIVLISPDTGEAEALLAEALSRLKHVTLLGQATAPMPPPLVEVEIPWSAKVIKIPSGTWEAPGGRTLTDQRVEPDVIWPATDTEGLMDRAREIVAEFQSARGGQ